MRAPIEHQPMFSVEEVLDFTLRCRAPKVRGAFSDEFRAELIKGCDGLSLKDFLEYAESTIGRYEFLANQPEYVI